MKNLIDADLKKIEATLKALATKGWSVSAYVPVLAEGVIGISCVGQQKNDDRYYTINVSSISCLPSMVGRFADLESAIAKLPNAVKEYGAEESFELVRLS